MILKLLSGLMALHVLSTQMLDVEDLSQSDQELFDGFRKRYQKKYANEEEMNFRFQIFLKNLRILKEEPKFESADGKVLLGSSFHKTTSDSPTLLGMTFEKSYSKGINEFIDLTNDEFSSYYLLPYDSLYRYLPSIPAPMIYPPQHPQYFGRFLQEINPLKDLPKKID